MKRMTGDGQGARVRSAPVVRPHVSRRAGDRRRSSVPEARKKLAGGEALRNHRINRKNNASPRRGERTVVPAKGASPQIRFFVFRQSTFQHPDILFVKRLGLMVPLQIQDVVPHRLEI